MRLNLQVFLALTAFAFVKIPLLHAYMSIPIEKLCGV